MIEYLLSLSLLIVVVLLIRGIFRKTVSPRVIYALWLVVVIRMLLPITLFEVDVTLPEFLQSQQIVQEEQSEQLPEDSGTSADVQEQSPVSTPMQTAPAIPSQSTSPTTPEYPTVITPITPTTPVAPTVPADTTPVTPDSQETIPDEVITPDETVSEVPEEPVSVNWKRIADLVWFCGAVIASVWVLLTSITYFRRLRKDRVFHRTVRGTKVYVSEYAGVPCIAGLVPSIYITPEAANSKSEILIIIHEHVHIRHGDHIWSIIRALALIVFWWNPFVWLAATVSKQDAELACDDAISSKMNDDGRLKYANILLDTIPQKHRYAVGLGSAPMKERILMLTKKQKNRWLSLILAIVLAVSAVGCSFVSLNEKPGEDSSNDKIGIITENLADFLTEEQIALYEKAGVIYPLFNGMSDDINILHLLLEGASFEEQANYRVAHQNKDDGIHKIDRTTYRPSYGEYDTFDEFKELCVSVFTEEYFEELNAADPYSSFIDYNGKLYNIDAARGGRFGYAPDEFPDEYELVEMSDEVIVFNVIGHYKSSNVNPVITLTEEAFTVKMVKSEEGWRFAKFADAGLDDGEYIGETDDVKQPDISGHLGIPEIIINPINELSSPEETALFSASPVGGNPTIFFFDDSLTFWFRKYLSVNMDAEYYTGTLTLPYGFSDGRVVYVTSGAGSGEIFVSIEAIYNGEKEYLTYGFFGMEAPSGVDVLDDVQTERLMEALGQANTSVVNVLENSGGLNINTIYLPAGENYTDAFRFDDRHILYVTWKDSQKNENGLYIKVGVHFYLIDILNGKIAAEAAYNGTFTSYYDDYTDDGLVLYDILYPDDTSGKIQVVDPVKITYINGALRVEKAQKESQYPRITRRITSPTGKYEVYNISESDGNILHKTSLEVRYSDGSVRRLFRNRTLEEVNSLSAVFTYTPMQFVDDTHFVYSLGGYESTKGFGIYDLATDKKIEFDHGAYDFCLAKDGVIIFRENVRNNEGLPEPYRLWSMTIDGEKTLLASLDEADGVMTMPGGMSYRTGEAWISFINNSKRVLPDYVSSHCVYETESLYSLDMSKKLAVIEYPSNGGMRAVRNMHFFENSVTIVIPVEPTSLEQQYGQGPFIGYVADAETPWIDLYTEKNGTYVGRIPYEIFNGWPATDRDREWWTPGWMSEYTCFYYAEFGDFCWAAVHLGDTVLGSGRKNIATSADGGKTWNCGSYMDDYGGNHVVGMYFVSDKIAFMSFDPNNVHELIDGPEISRTIDGGKTWKRLVVSVPDSLKGKKLLAGTPIHEGDVIRYPIRHNPAHGSFEGETMYIISRDNGMTWEWDALNQEQKEAVTTGSTKFATLEELFSKCDKKDMLYSKEDSIKAADIFLNPEKYRGEIDEFRYSSLSALGITDHYFTYDKESDKIYITFTLTGTPVGMLKVGINTCEIVEDIYDVYVKCAEDTNLGSEASDAVARYIYYCRAYGMPDAVMTRDIFFTDYIVSQLERIGQPKTRDAVIDYAKRCFSLTDYTPPVKQFDENGNHIQLGYGGAIFPYLIADEQKINDIYTVTVQYYSDNSYQGPTRSIKFRVTKFDDGAWKFIDAVETTQGEWEQSPTENQTSLCEYSLIPTNSTGNIVSLKLPAAWKWDGTNFNDVNVRIDVYSYAKRVTLYGGLPTLQEFENTLRESIGRVYKMDLPITGKNDAGYSYTGYYGDEEMQKGEMIRRYLFYISTDKGAYTLEVWQRLDFDGENFFEDTVLPIVRSFAIQKTLPHQAIMENKSVLYDVSAKKEMLLSDHLKTTGMSISKYSVIDLDKDADLETVLWLTYGTNEYVGFLVLHSENNNVYAHGFTYRGFYDLKEDGTFHFSGGISNNGTGKIDFSGDTYTINKIAYCESDDNENVSYYVENKSVSKEEFDAYETAQSQKTTVVWYDYTSGT